MENASLIKADLLANINELLGGAKVLEITTQDEYARCVDLLDKAKACRTDLAKEYEEKFMPRSRALDVERETIWNAKKNPLNELIKNLTEVSGVWAIEQKRIADEAKAKEQKRIDDEKKRLADEADARLRDEQKLRDDATELLAQAETVTGAEREALIEKSNDCIKVADIAVEEAVDATKKIDTLKPAASPAFHSFGFKPKLTPVATVYDENKAMKHIADNNLWWAITSAAFTKCVEKACNKIATTNGKDYKMDGVTITEKAGGR